jgi:hypothetical protein
MDLIPLLEQIAHNPRGVRIALRRRIEMLYRIADGTLNALSTAAGAPNNRQVVDRHQHDLRRIPRAQKLIVREATPAQADASMVQN